MEELEKLKPKLSATVTAVGSSGCSITELAKLFRDDWLTDIPYAQCGFPNLVALLEDMPDAVTLSQTAHGDYVVRPVRREELTRVLDLVDRTAPTTSQGRANYARSRTSRPVDNVYAIQDHPGTSVLIENLEMGEVQHSSNLELGKAQRPKELTYDVLLNLLKESNQIQSQDIPVKAKKRLNLKVTLDKLNQIFRTNASTEVEAYAIGFRGIFDVKPTKNGNAVLTYVGNDQKSQVSAQEGVSKKKKEYTKAVLIENIQRFTANGQRMYLNGHENYAKQNYNVPDLSLDTLNRVLRQQARTRKEALAFGLAGFADVGGLDTNIHITLSSAAPVSKDKRSRFLAWLEKLAPIYASSLWREYHKEFGQEATLLILNDALGTSAESRIGVLQAVCTKALKLQFDPAFNTQLVFYPADSKSVFLCVFERDFRRQEDQRLSEICLCKKEHQVDFDLDMLNKTFGCRETTRKAIIEKSLKNIVRLIGKDDGEGMRLQLLYVQGTKQEELMKASTSSLNSQSTTRSVSTAQSAELRSNTSSPVPLSQMKPVQAVAPHVTKTKTAKNKQCQTDREDKVKPLVPTNLEGLAEELTVFLKKAGGIRITVSDAITMFRNRYDTSKSQREFPTDYEACYKLVRNIVISSHGLLNLCFVNELAFVEPASRKPWNPHEARQIQLPMCTENLRVLPLSKFEREGAEHTEAEEVGGTSEDPIKAERPAVPPPSVPVAPVAPKPAAKVMPQPSTATYGSGTAQSVSNRANFEEIRANKREKDKEKCVLS
ncbi:hypothetical protein L596_026770 [Steinernema carpocapsae]|uniref:HTH OST-type domain-containing protein n=1 Tax=Steinernema carpocapsae TaxID=34508 RepID=A0A4V6XVP9_STECR|nr:hypothetical protein L596_026770 [Steinernema carpocapsae]